VHNELGRMCKETAIIYIKAGAIPAFPCGDWGISRNSIRIAGIRPTVKFGISCTQSKNPHHLNAEFVSTTE